MTQLLGVLTMLLGLSAVTSARQVDPAPPMPTTCEGCAGGADSDTDSSNSGPCGSGASISISATVAAGSCRVVQVIDSTWPLSYHWECKQDEACQATIVRSWTNFPVGEKVDHCVFTHPGRPRLCITPTPTAGTSNGSTTIGPYPMNCGSEYTWTASGCALLAVASVECTKCAI